MTPAEVLRISSFDCDQFLSRDQLYGSLQRGKRAVFFLVPVDPSRDISAVRQFQLVMKDGVIYYPKEIYEELGIKPFGLPPAVSVPPRGSAEFDSPGATPTPYGRFGEATMRLPTRSPRAKASAASITSGASSIL